ncbi:hypothetical protein Q9L58_010660 [Maublancomyces gigas]|uniref:Uncharacterized protein n=1 Tax=Discina gigas TaxID=1032678 RepID=A0ABR3G3G5_9PEZI
MSLVHSNISETREDDWVADSDALLPGPAPPPPSSPPTVPRSPKAAMTNTNKNSATRHFPAETPSSDPLTGRSTRHDIRHQPIPLRSNNSQILPQKSACQSPKTTDLPTHEYNPMFGNPIGGGTTLSPYNFQTSFLPLPSRAGTPKRPLMNPINKPRPANCQAPTDQAGINDLLLRQNEEMTKKFTELKMLITNLGNQMTNSMAALAGTVIGKVDGIHRTFNAFPNTTPKNQPNPRNSNQQPTTDKKGKGKEPAERLAAPPPTPDRRKQRSPLPTRVGTRNNITRTTSQHMGQCHKKQKDTKDNQTPPKEKKKKPATTKSMIVQRTGEEKNKTLNLLHIRNSINRDLIKAKAPESLQVTGISWNQKGNLMLYTRDGFQNEDFNLHQAVITTAVAKADPTSMFVNKQETWHKLTVHGVSLETYPDKAIGTADLKREVEYCNTNLQIATEPRYMTHPS